MLRQLLLTAHVLGAIVWVGGMVFAHFCLRPAALETLDPPHRLPLMAAALGRFLRITSVAVAAILLSGAALIAAPGLAAAPPGWHAMLLLGVVMAGVFVFVYGVVFPRLRRACQARDWPAGAAALATIRTLVLLNLVLGTLTVVAALSARG